MSDLPKGWTSITINEVAEGPGQYGSSAAALPYDPSLPRYVRVTDMDSDGTLKSDTFASIRASDAAPYMLKEGDLLFARSGSVGKTYLYEKSDGPCAYAGYVIKFEIDQRIAFPRYVWWWTRSAGYWRWVRRMFRQAAQPNINAAEYGKHRFPLPPLEEQRRIAEVLDALDEQIATAERAMEKLQQLSLAFADSYFLRQEEEEIPGGWKKVALSEIVTAPICYGIIQVDDHVPGGVPVVMIRDIGASFKNPLHRVSRSLDAHYSRSKIVPGDVLLSIKGTVGRVAVVPDYLAGNISRDIARLRFSEVVSPRFVEWLLRTNYGQRLLETSIVGTTRSEISISVLNRMTIPVPPPCEQLEIVQNISLIDAQIQCERSRLDKLRWQRAGLAEDLLTGRVRI